MTDRIENILQLFRESFFNLALIFGTHFTYKTVIIGYSLICDNSYLNYKIFS